MIRECLEVRIHIRIDCSFDQRNRLQKELVAKHIGCPFFLMMKAKFQGRASALTQFRNPPAQAKTLVGKIRKRPKHHSLVGKKIFWMAAKWRPWDDRVSTLCHYGEGPR